MLLGAMRRMPGNASLEQRIEYGAVAKFYLPRALYVLVMVCYHANCILTLMSLIIQSGQVMDYLTLNLYGCAPGWALAPSSGYVCGTRIDSSTPFGDSVVLSSSMVLVAIFCLPFALKNLDDNVALQYMAVIGLVLMSITWMAVLAQEPSFPRPLPVATSSQGSLIGTVLFNFAFASTLPSWVNEKHPATSVGTSFAAAVVFVVLIYTMIGIVGGMAYEPFYMTDENLFSKLNAGSSRLGRATVTAYPMLQNFTSIPVLSIMIRHNLLQSGIDPALVLMIAVGVPWLVCVPFYTGGGFDTVSEIGGLATSSVVNFLVPAGIYLLALSRTGGFSYDSSWKLS